MNTRLVIAIVNNTIEQIVIVLAVVWGLPKINVNLPLWSLGIINPVWLVYSVYVYRKGTGALRRKQIAGMQNMAGMKGVVVNDLDPNGMVLIKGELWSARSSSGRLEAGREITVLEQDRLKLLVRADDAASRS